MKGTGIVGALLLAACAHPVLPAEQTTLPAHEIVLEDSSHKESPRLVPAEVYLRTYLRIFSGKGGTTAIQAQQKLSGNALFDNWNAYLGALGLPNYPIDLPRKQQTNALMLATFERLGVALCDRAVEHDLKSRPPLPLAERTVFTFDLPPPKVPLDAAGFAERFDRLHRIFLGYPAKLALTPRTERFYQLYKDTIFRHVERKSRFTPVEAAWAAVCYGLIRHPEFHLY